MKMFKFTTVVCALGAALLPGVLAVYWLRMFGHSVHETARIGLSFIHVDKIGLASNTRIGHFNAIFCTRLIMRDGASFGRKNFLFGPFSLWLKQGACIGNRNKVTRGPRGSVSFRASQLKLGLLTKLTADHRIDLTSSVVFGDYSILAGSACQLWTHGYVHEENGAGRYRIDGKIVIGDNVYIGSGSIVNAGFSCADGVILGSGIVVAKPIKEKGLYVAAGIRQLPRPKDPDSRADMERVDDPHLADRVYRKP